MSGSLIFRIVVLLVWTAIPAYGQHGTIEGRVTDVAGAPLPGAHVRLEGTALGDAADADGRYRIGRIPPGTYELRASIIGYTPDARQVTVAADEVVTAEFTLEEMTLQSGEVIVTASRRAEAAGGVAASVRTLSAEDIRTRNTVALDDALRYVPGVQMAGNQVNIRGSSGFSYNTGSRVLLLIDGMPMLRPDADGIPFDAVPMQHVEQIEILKGPGSALYGGGALGGIIHVITNAYPREPETFLEGYAGAYEPVRYTIWRNAWSGADRPRPLAGVTASHGRPLGERSGFWTSISYRYDAGHLNLSRRRSLQAFTKLTWRPATSAKLDVLTGFNRRTSDSFLFWNGARDPLNPGRIELGQATIGTGSDDNLINELSFQPSYVDALSSTLLLNVKARLFGVLIQAIDEKGRPKPLEDGTVGFRYGAEVQLDYEPSPLRRITVGAVADANATRSGFFDADDPLSQPEGAAFLQLEQTVSEQLRFTGGLRFDTYRIRAGQVERKLSPRLSAAYSPGPRLTLRAAYGEGFRVPSVAERFIENSDYLPVVSNLELRPETSRSYEIGIRAYPRPAPFGLRLSIDGALFWSGYRDLVEPTFVPSQRAFQFINLTRARIRGLEITMDAGTASGRASVFAGYTFLDADDLTLNQPLVFRSRHLFKGGLTGRIGPVTLGADVRIESAPERVDSDFARFIRDALIVEPPRVLDLRIGSSWKGIEARLHVKNALDYYYLERPALLAPPRHAMLQVSTTL